LLKRGATEFTIILDTAVDALEHAFHVATRGLDVRRQPHEATKALDRLLQTIAKGPRLSSSTSSDQMIREATMLGRLARMFEVQEELLRRRLADLRRAQSRPRLQGDNFVEVEPLTLPSWERELLEVMLLEPESVAAIAEEIAAASLATEQVRLIYDKCCTLTAEGITPDFDRLMTEFDDAGIKNLLVDVEERAREKSGASVAPGRLRDLLAWHRSRDQEYALQAQARALRDPKLHDDDALRMLNELVERERTRQGISAPTEG
jgi:DNA primase